MISELTCIHCAHGLCPQCQEEYEVDPQAYVEFGDHPDGIARWEAVCQEMAGEAIWDQRYTLVLEGEALPR